MTPEQIKQVAKQAGGINYLQYIALDHDALNEFARLVRESDGDDLMIAYMAGAASNKTKSVADYVPLSDARVDEIINSVTVTDGMDGHEWDHKLSRAIERAVREAS